MTNGAFLLDTNIIIAFHNGDRNVAACLREAEVFLPIIALGELYYGAYRSGKRAANIQRVERIRNKIELLHCDSVTAQLYGEIKEELSRKGNPIPENDLWIAAIARQYRLIVASRDRHFDKIDGLTVDGWDA